MAIIAVLSSTLLPTLHTPPLRELFASAAGTQAHHKDSSFTKAL
jgi:hypothetical protein